MRRWIAAVVLGLLAVSEAGPAHAHDLRAGLLELRGLGEDRFAVTFKISTPLGSTTAGVTPVLPSRCQQLTAPKTHAVPRGVLVRWMAACRGGLAGATVAARWTSSEADVLLRIVPVDGAAITTVLTRARPAYQVVADQSPGAMEVAAQYTSLGFEHILLGYDHLLFLVCLLLLCARRRVSVVLAVTAFTVGHSVSLALVTLGVVGLPVPPIEAAIAASVVFLAAALARRDGEVGIERPWAFAVAFGILHGFGFAGALAEVGLPAQEIPLALVAFNVGVELGQLAFVFVAFSIAWTLSRARVPVVRSRALPYVVGTVAAFWLIQRVAAFWSGGVS